MEPSFSQVELSCFTTLLKMHVKQLLVRNEAQKVCCSCECPIDDAVALCHHPDIAERPPIGLRVSILASGSSGNCTLLETQHTRLVVDAGLGKRETLARLSAIESKFSRLDGILISHEHTDHCNGLPQML